MNVSFAGFGENIATFETAAAIPAGTPVKMSANGTVAACAAGDAFIGIAVSQRGDFVGVQLKGYRNAAVTGSVPVGWAQLVADGSGGVKAAGEDAAGISVLVVSAGTAEIGMSFYKKRGGIPMAFLRYRPLGERGCTNTPGKKLHPGAGGAGPQRQL